MRTTCRSMVIILAEDVLCTIIMCLHKLHCSAYTTFSFMCGICWGQLQQYQQQIITALKITLELYSRAERV